MPNTVKAPVDTKPSATASRDHEYAAFVRRILDAYSRRVGSGDIEVLALMLGLGTGIDAIIDEAVNGLRAAATPGPKSGSRLDISRQAAQR